MYISRVEIKNYRSIESLDLNLSDLNVFVGPNDSGKSNILRALHLFFGEQQGAKTRLDWEADFCRFANTPAKKAKFIRVALTAQIPESFKGVDEVIWWRTWRESGLHDQDITLPNGNPLPRHSKVSDFLRRVRFDYVPAIKGQSYFAWLMGEIHDMLQSTASKQVRQASGEFTAVLNKNTKSLLEQIGLGLSMNSEIELPTNLHGLFSELEFFAETAGERFPLSVRGDGLKVRHIPHILKWLSTQANLNSAAGRPKTSSIWGYEEPENSLELNSCLELAQYFLRESRTTQTFLTTHSPAVYSVGAFDAQETNVGEASIFHVARNEGTGLTEVRLLGPNDFEDIDSSVGLSQLIAPKIAEVARQREELKEQLSELRQSAGIQCPTVFVEGESDRELFSDAFSRHFPNRKGDIDFKGPGIGKKGGFDWVCSRVKAYQHLQQDLPVVGLVDCDKGAERAASITLKEVKKGGKKKCAWVECVQWPDQLTKLNETGLKVPLSVDELLPEWLWDSLESEGLLAERNQASSLYSHADPKTSFVESLKNKGLSDHEQRVTLFKVASNGKAKLAELVRSKRGKNRDEALLGLVPTLTRLVERLDKLGADIAQDQRGG